MSAKILVAEDKQNIQLAIQAKLIKSGYDVRVASNGQEALNLVHADKPDLIFLDIMMPEKDGFDVIQALKADPATMAIPVVFLTNYGYGFMREQARTSGAVDYVVKSDARLSDIADIADRLLSSVSTPADSVATSDLRHGAQSSPH